jgi:hypothetical protein
LRTWSPERLGRALAGDSVPVLSQNLVTMSKIVWRKHRLVRASMFAASIGVVLIALAGAIAPRSQCVLTGEFAIGSRL